MNEDIHNTTTVNLERGRMRYKGYVEYHEHVGKFSVTVRCMDDGRVLHRSITELGLCNDGVVDAEAWVRDTLKSLHNQLMVEEDQLIPAKRIDVEGVTRRSGRRLGRKRA